MNANLLRWIVWIVMIIGCVVVSTIYVNQALRLTASPTVTTLPTVTPTAVPTLTAIPTPTPVPTDTRVPLSLLERYEDLAERGIVTRGELEFGDISLCGQLSHSNDSKEKCRATVIIFQGPDGLEARFEPKGWNTSTGEYDPNSHRRGAWTIGFEGGGYGSGVGEGYMHAHNFWVYLTNLARGDAVYYPTKQIAFR